MIARRPCPCIRLVPLALVAVAALVLLTGCPSDPNLEITTSALQDTSNGAAYSVTVSASGGRSTSYTWSVLSGSLPAGLTLTSGTPTATIDGTVTAAAGRYDFVLLVKGDAGDADERAFSILVDQRRWVVFRGDTFYDGLDELMGVDVSASPPDDSGFISTGDFVTSSASDEAFSPDGDWVAWLEYQAGDPELFLADMRGQVPVNYQQLSPNSASGVQRYEWAPDSQALAFISDLSAVNRFELFISFRESDRFTSPGRLHTALSSGRDVTDFAFSPDGNYVAWIADADTNDRFELFVTDISADTPGTTVKVMTVVSGGDVASIRFSPDSSMLAFAGDVDTADTDELYLADLVAFPTISTAQVNGGLTAGGDVRTLAERDYEFAPDSSGIAYVADQQTDERFELYWSQIVGGTPQTPQKVNDTLVANGDVFSFLWSPDSSALLFNADGDVDGENEIWLVDVSGGTPGTPAQVNQQLAGGSSIPSATEFTGYSFSPDGSKIAFIGDDVAAGRYELWVTDTATLATPARVNKLLVNNSQDVRSYVWSPDSQHLVYDSNEESLGTFELWRSDVSAPASPGTPEQLNGAIVGSGVLPAADGTGFGYSPDGSYILYLADENVSGRVELFYVDLSSGSPAAPDRLNNRLPFGGDIHDFEPER